VFSVVNLGQRNFFDNRSGVVAKLPKQESCGHCATVILISFVDAWWRTCETHSWVEMCHEGTGVVMNA